MVVAVKNYLSLVKFSHTIFAMPFAFIGYFLAYHSTGNQISWILLLLVILCMVFARNAAMSFNRVVDRHQDKLNPRTRQREIPRGIIKPGSALIFAIINSILFIITTWFINKLVFFLSPLALLIILLYSYTKRWTYLCHLVLGLGLSLAPTGAYLAVTGHFSLMPLLYSLIVLFWVSGFDIIYSLQDEEFDRQENLKSIPSFIGREKALQVAAVFHSLAGAIVIFVGIKGNLDIWYWIGSILFIILLIYQHMIINPTSIRKVNIAFATTNGIASITYAFFNIISFIA